MASSRSVALPALVISSSSSSFSSSPSSMLLRRALHSSLSRPLLPSASPSPFLRRAFAAPSPAPAVAVAVSVSRLSGRSPILLPPARQSLFGRSPSAAAPPSPPPPPPSAFMSALSSTGIEDARRSPFVPLPSSDTADKIELYKGLEAAIGSPFSSDPSVPHPNPQILVISGPSGVGKDAVIKRLQEARGGIHFVVTATSRPQRPGEIDGKDYYFVTKEEFLLMVERNELLEYALVYGDYKGIPKQQIRDYMTKGYDIVLRVDIQGAATLRSILGDSAVFIFLVAESEEALVKRLVARKTETSEMLLVRISTAREEMKHMKNFDYVVVNAEGKLDGAVKLIESIIDAEKARVQQRKIKV